MPFNYTNADSLFDNNTADADGQVVLTRYNDLKSWLNGPNVGPASLDLTGIYPWTARHSWTITDATHNNKALIVGGIMAVGFYGDSISSAVAQINSPLIYRELSNASSTVPIEELHNAGTGDTHKVVNTNTGACYLAETSSTGYPFKAKVRDLTDLNAPLVSKVITTPTSITNDSTETPISDATINLPANFLKIGTTIKGSFYGTLDTPGAGPATVYFKVKLGGIAGTTLLDSGTITPTISLVGSLVKIDYILTCITVGATGTIEAQGEIHWNSNTAPVVKGLGIAGTGNANIAPIVIDTTTQKDLILEFKMGTAVVGSTVAIRNGIVEIKR